MRLNLGRSALHFNTNPVCGKQVTLAGEDFFRIDHYDRMRSFLMSIVSGGDHWMFISSTGALTAGRRDADLALFPYYTDDKIHDSAGITGSRTLCLVEKSGRLFLWEPFSKDGAASYRVERSLFKNFCGNKLIFEESNADLGLSFRYGWFNSDRFGWVRRAWLTNLGAATVKVSILDGIQNLMPSGTGSRFQLEYSTLLDAYKRSELVSETGLGLFRLSAIPVDRPEPAEALRATTVWSLGLGRSSRLLSSTQVDSFRQGLPLREETDVRAERGAYFIETRLSLRRGQSKDWWLVADVAQGPSQVARLNHLLRQPARLLQQLQEDISRGTEDLKRIVGTADGIQKTAEPLGNARHFGNVLFNVMRGGVFCDGHQVNPVDLHAFIRRANKDVAARQAAFFARLGKSIHYNRLVQLAEARRDPQLERLCREYLPLTFSRRHGDPSRPWNRFSIATKRPDGSRILNYEGNWRDLFQNWEALATSFPAYTAGMICKFVNASTADGYNPYRVTRQGIDWEVLDPADPWSHIGYWGDHQVIYLLKLLEILDRHDPSVLRDFLTREIFSYANVPYRIKSYAELLKDPKETVLFDRAAEDLVQRRVALKGGDGKLVWDESQEVRLVNLSEKLLVPLFAKLSNFIPGAGIWLNTQRPEWNDANNALVGNGVSMVTLYYLRRYLAFCLRVFRPLESADVRLSEEVARFLRQIHKILKCCQLFLGRAMNDTARKSLLDDLGRAGSHYREALYRHGLCGRKAEVQGRQILNFFEVALAFVDDSIRSNQRPDGLYHAYNLVRFDQPKKIPIRRLYEMLEGQVAVLSSGCLSARESLVVLRALRRSAMFRADQHSYLLYPNRELPRFLDRNNLSPALVKRSCLLRKLVNDGEPSLIERDVNGRFHFNGSITNARDVSRILDQLAATGYPRLVKLERALVLDAFEDHFDHQSFTGRSGTFFGYEGLGSIYWHMVSKLLLAAQESFFRAADAGESAAVLDQLADCYYDIRMGIGDRKSPEVYGAFPMDPYSHTPAHAGARQPGLTGQVKEDILCRAGELGVMVAGGQLCFRPLLLRRNEFLTAPGAFEYFDLNGTQQLIPLGQGCLAFTWCQVPVVYRLAATNRAEAFFASGSVRRQGSLRLDAETSRSLFDRAGKVQRIEVSLDAKSLR
jgi:hypothetical protein